LEEALRGDDTQGITLAAERLDQLAQDVIRTHGVVGARAQSAQAKLQQVREAVDTGRLLLSEVEDLDFAEAITRLQSAQIALQADLQTSAQLMSLSLLDFIG
jgi:flagellar hook-associated protein 3 FlgL